MCSLCAGSSVSVFIQTKDQPEERLIKLMCTREHCRCTEQVRLSALPTELRILD